MKGVVCHHYHQKSYSGIARKVLEPIGQTEREFIAAVWYETIHQIQSDWLLWLSRFSHFASPSTVPDSGEQQYSEGSRQGR